MSELPPDFRDLLVELTVAGAEFVIVGGYAVAFHGHGLPDHARVPLRSLPCAVRERG